MKELDHFIAMLQRSGIGHGLRIDHNPSGTAVQVEMQGGDSEWWFDESGNLVTTLLYE